jgi:PAS domain S-box-containing protein
MKDFAMIENNNEYKTVDSLRTIAELRLKKTEADQSTQKTFLLPDQTNPLLHELQVHRIELEMQNEELRNAQMELEASRARYFDLYDLAPVGYLMVSEKGLILEANLTATTMLNTPKNALIHRPLSSFIHQDYQDVYYWHRKGLYLNGVSPAYELRMCKNGGVEFWANIVTTLAPGCDSVNACRVVLTDVTERKQAEHALRQIQDQYHSLAEHCNGIVYSLSADGIVTYVSGSYKQVLGRDPAEIIGKNFAQAVHPEDAARCASFYQEIAKTNITRGIEYRILHHDGSTRWHLSHLIPYRNKTNKIESFIGIAMDITDQKLVQANLEATSQMKSEFLALVSHEIRTPLNALVGFSALARTEINQNTLKQYIEIINESACSLMNLVNDILDMSKIEAGELQLEHVPFNLKETIDCINYQYGAVAEQKMLSFQVRRDGNLPTWVIGDPVRFRQIFSNLLDNAIKFTELGEITFTITAAAKQAQSGSCLVRFDMSDTGIGIPKDKRHLLFQPFQQSDVSINRKYGGTGLGLAIVYRLVKLMNGSIEVTSEPGQGSCFAVELPFEISSTVQSVERKSLAMVPLRVLIVEDSAFNRRLLMDTLVRWGHQVAAVENGLQALEVARCSIFDLIIVDIRMPDMDGIQLTCHLRKEEKIRNAGVVPIIAYTADTGLETREQCLAAGVNSVLFKPLDPNALAFAIYDLFQQCYPSD